VAQRPYVQLVAYVFHLEHVHRVVTHMSLRLPRSCPTP
jgi:hypothetical protein